MPYGGSPDDFCQARQTLQPAEDQDRDDLRYFIVTHGRSGSSLLAAILDGVGADFGSAHDRGGDTESDHWESHRIERAIRCAEEASQYFSPAMSGLRRAAYRFWRSRAKSLLKAGLRDAIYSKNRWNTSILPLVEKLGLQPVPIVTYRHPGEIALSDMRQLKTTPSALFPSITRTFMDALYALERYGGVVIDYSELVNPNEETWADALAEVTGFSVSALLASRKALLRARPPREDSTVWLPGELRGLAQNLSSLRNKPLRVARDGAHVKLSPISS